MWPSSAGGQRVFPAALELGRRPALDVYLFENEEYLGGIPRSAHVFFGMRDLKRAYSGKGYARRLEKLVRRDTCEDPHPVNWWLKFAVGNNGQRHHLTVSSPDGLVIYESRHVLLAMGCFEGSRGSRMLPGTATGRGYHNGHAPENGQSGTQGAGPSGRYSRKRACGLFCGPDA